MTTPQTDLPGLRHFGPVCHNLAPYLCGWHYADLRSEAGIYNLDTGEKFNVEGKHGFPEEHFRKIRQQLITDYCRSLGIEQDVRINDHGDFQVRLPNGNWKNTSIQELNRTTTTGSADSLVTDRRARQSR